VPPELDFEKSQARERQLFDLFRKAHPDTSEEEVQKLWFYHDRA